MTRQGANDTPTDDEFENEQSDETVEAVSSSVVSRLKEFFENSKVNSCSVVHRGFDFHELLCLIQFITALRAVKQGIGIPMVLAKCSMTVF